MLSALSVNVGNAIALIQTNIVRKIAYSSVSHDRFVLISLAVVGMSNDDASELRTDVVYMLVCAAINLDMFDVIMSVSNKS